MTKYSNQYKKTPDYKRKTEQEFQGYRDLKPSEYSFEMKEAVKFFYGHIEFDELAEALRVSAQSLLEAARALGLLHSTFDHVEAPEVERFMNLMRSGVSTNKLAQLYGIDYNPDRKFFKSQFDRLNNMNNQEGLF